MSVEKSFQKTNFFLGVFPENEKNSSLSSYRRMMRENKVLCCPFDDISGLTVDEILQTLPDGCEEFAIFPITTYLDSSSFESTSIVSYNFMFLFQKQALSDYVRNSNVSSLMESLILCGSSKFSVEQSNMARTFKNRYGKKSGYAYKR